ncbi:MmgE/PrpD family protein [Labrys wisconsinensis]|nr:MmgE/PrpD family protein [Labrys wisconsinensis]
MTTAFQFAAHVRSIQATPPAVRMAATRAVLDLVGAAIAGAVTRSGAAARRAAVTSWGVGPAHVWFSADRLTPPGAAFVNAAYGSMLDLDDGHRAAAGHPGAAVIPAALATAQAVGAGADRLLTAIAIGYEVGVRVAAARDFDTLRTTDSGLWCSYAVAAAAGWLRGLAPDVLVQALAIAGTSAPGLSAAGWSSVGNTVKEGIAWSTASGLAAVDLAAAGFTGPVDVLDDARRYDPARMTRDLGRGWAIEGIYFKLYSCCRWAHAAIDAALALQADHAIATEAIRHIEVATFPRALMLPNDPAPASLEAAQYSIPFCVALALVRGAGALLPMQEAHLADAQVLALAARIRLTVDPAYETAFPAMVPARVTMTSTHGARSLAVPAPKGEPTNPLSIGQQEEKFRALAGPNLSEPAAARLKATILALNHQAEIDSLMSALSAPLGEASLLPACQEA